MLRGVTFEGSKINDNSFLYIYLKVLYPTGPKMIYKKFESCIIDQGVKLQYQKLNIIFNSKVIRCGLGVGNALSTGPYSVFFTSFDTYTTNFVFESFWSMISGSEVLENFELWRLKLSV